MCVMSMVMDHYGPRFPDPFEAPFPFPPGFLDPSTIGPIDLKPIEPVESTPIADLLGSAAAIAELRALIREFREAVAAAKTVDVLTKQPDCEDPEKAKLLERVE